MLTGGAIADLNASGKCWAHRPGIHWWHHLLFVAGHAVPLALFVWLFRAGSVALFSSSALLLLGGAAGVLLTPPRMQRAAGLLATLLGLLILQGTNPPIREAAWFLPLLYARLLIAYLPAPLPASSRSGPDEC